MNGSLVTKTIVLASDHAGFELKNYVRDFLLGQGRKVEDLGAKKMEAGDDYPALITPLAMRIAEQSGQEGGSSAGSQGSCVGIIFGKSGQGEAIVANRFPGVRAAVYYGGSLDIIKLSREHNDSNVLSLGAGFLTREEARAAVELWLATAFSGEERHERRIEMIDSIS